MDCPGTSAGRVSRQSETVSRDPLTMSRSSAIRRSKSSAKSGERSLNQTRRVAGGLIGRQAARYCCHTSGTFGTATCTKIVDDGGAGFDFGCMFACLGSRSPLRLLHGAQQVTTLSHEDGPPLERGITWSTVSCEWFAPQYWHSHWSRAKIARRVILRLCASRGTRT